MTFGRSESRQETTAMPFKVGKLDQKERARDKQASRDRDAARLKSGDVSREQLASENNPFSGLGLENFHVVSIGRRKV
jgi:hypothetical protein